MFGGIFQLNFLGLDILIFNIILMWIYFYSEEHSTQRDCVQESQENMGLK